MQRLRFHLGPRRPRRERTISVVPMINIVFLLLVFFLLTATVAPPDPVPVRLPQVEGRGAVAAESAVLHVAADGAVALGSLRDEAAFAALADWPEGETLAVRADADLDGGRFAAVLARLGALGVAQVSVVVLTPGTEGAGP